MCLTNAMTCFFWQHFKKRVAGRVLCVVLAVSKLQVRRGGGTPIMVYRGRQQAKGVLFSGIMYMKGGRDFTS